MIGYSESLERKYMPYAIFDENEEIIGFQPDTPKEALDAAREHITMSKKFDDATNYEYWDELRERLGL